MSFASRPDLLQPLIRSRQLAERILEIDRHRNLMVQRPGCFPRLGDEPMRAVKVEICRKRRLAVDHVAKWSDAFFSRLYAIIGKDQGE